MLQSKGTDRTSNLKESKAKIFLRFLKFGLLAWGGPIAQIAMIRQELVEEEKWVSREQFNRILAVYQVLPGPEAHELCVYFGMISGGRWGGFFAGLGFMLPGFILMLLLTWFYIQFGNRFQVVNFIFAGFQSAVIALIFMATYRIGKHALINIKLFLIAVISAAATFTGVHFLIVLPLAGLAYVFLIQRSTAGAIITVLLFGILVFIVVSQAYSPGQQDEIISNYTPMSSSPLIIFLSGLKGGLLTFGGAYTVIPFIQQDAVVNYGWMTNEQFLDGIALSGILPAPLIIFTTFVGYFAGGWPGALIITAAIFLPAFSFTLIGHKFIEKIIENRSLHSFLDGLTAGVIGLIIITAIQLFRVEITQLSSLVIFILSFLLLYFIKSKYIVVLVIILSGVISLIYNYINV